jgi:RimJ/RimL family protein N-acetyltransferase
MLHIRSERLQLVAVTLELAQAERAGPQRLEKLLHAHVPPSWPPPLNDEATLRWTIDFLTRHPHGVGWGPWYFLHREHAETRLVGQGGFAGLPGADGTVEIGYSIVPECHRLGLAPEAVRALVTWAFGHREVVRVVAHTLPALVPSIRVLEKCGFTPAGEGAEPGTVRYSLERAAGPAESSSSARR